VIAGVGGAFAGAGNYWWDANRNAGLTAYELTRTETGWTPSVLTPPATRFPHSTLMAASGESLGTTLWGAATSTLTFNENIYLRDSEGDFALVGPGTGPEIRDESLKQASNELNLVGASHDLSHAIFSVSAFSVGSRLEYSGRGNLWPGDTTNEEAASLYEYVGTGNAAPTLVGVSDGSTVVGGVTLPAGQQISRCGTKLGSGGEGINGVSRDTYNAVSEDGEKVFFTARACSDGPGEPAVDELYARVGQSKTVAISEPSLPAGECTSPEPCSTATPREAIFQGASENGERVFVLREQSLVNGAPAAGIKLYEARLEGSTVSQLVDVSADPTSGQSPEVQGVVRVSEDGGRVYFVAKGKLAGINAEDKEPEAGADNLYVYEPEPADPGGYHTVFVAKLLTTPESTLLTTPEESEESTLKEEETKEEGEVGERAEKVALRAFEEATEHGVEFEKALEIYTQVKERQEKLLRGTLGTAGTLAEDQSVWKSEDRRPAQATPDGNFLVFPSSADLAAGDESKVPQLFEYDASSESLTRISSGQGGTYNGDGNVDTFNEAAHIPAPAYVGQDLPTAAQTGLAVSEDGSRVFFTSAARLVPQVEDRGSPNVYEYRDGNVYLISDGKDSSATENGPTVQLFGSDASGQDSFFVTADALVPQAGDAQVGLYDAREGGGFPVPALIPGCAGETCRGATGAAPSLQLPGSTSQAGGGNLPPPVESKPATKPKAAVKVLGHSVHGTTITLTVAAPAKGTIVAYGAGLQTTKHRTGGAMTYTLKVGLSARERASVKRLRRHKLRYKRKLTVRVRFVPTSGEASQTSVLAMVKA
jgi:hypothetical protein